MEEIGDIFQQICKEIDEDYQRKLRGYFLLNSYQIKTFKYSGLEKIDKDENLQITQILLNMLNPAVNALGLHIVQLADEYYRSMDYWVLVSELHFSTAHLHSGTLNKEEIAMFHSWLKLMFREYQQTERDGHDSAAEKIFDPNEGHYKTAGELNLSKALIYAKAKGWTMARAQLLLKKMCQQGWIRRIEGFDQKRHNKSRSKRMSSMDLENANIRLNPCAVAELEPLLNKLHVPNCVICKHPVVVSRLAHTCEDCKAFYHGSCMLRYFKHLKHTKPWITSILRVLEFPAKCLGPNCSTVMEAECLEVWKNGNISFFKSEL